MNFSDVIGQEKIVAHMKSAILEKKLSHAYILSGEKGSGKKLISGIFAAAIQCEKGLGSPCGECQSCKQAAGGNNPDIHWITHEKPNVISVDEIRVQLNSDITIKPYSRPHKVYIIDEAEKMNEQAQNAILKTIEEPPEYAVIILLVTNEKLFLPTILSRCILLNLRAVSKAKIQKLLEEKHGISGYMAEVAAGFADGVPGRAIEFAESDRFIELKADVLSLLKRVDGMDAGQLYGAIKGWSDKAELQERLSLTNMWYRDILVAKSTDDTVGILFKDEETAIYNAASELSYQEIIRKLDAISTLQERIKANVNLDASLMLLFLTLRDRG